MDVGHLSLSEVLKRLGFTHARTAAAVRLNLPTKHIYNAEGQVVFTGTSGDVWRWLHEERLITSAYRDCFLGGAQ